MAQKKNKKYVYHNWDDTCVKAEEFLMGIRNEFRENGYNKSELGDFVISKIVNNMDNQDVVLSQKTLTAMLGCLCVSFHTDKEKVKYAMYDAVMNLWSYMGGIYMSTYERLFNREEKEQYLEKKQLEFLQWYAVHSSYHIARYYYIIHKALNVVMSIRFEPEEYDRPTIVMAYVYLDKPVEIGKSRK